MICPAGERWNHEECVPCDKETYNHGGAPAEKEDCYKINNREIVYKDRFSVQCAPGWAGIPHYEDGEYEGGCEDNDPFILNFKQIGSYNNKCEGNPYINWNLDKGPVLLTENNCAEWCLQDDSCCKKEKENCRPCCLSFTLNESLCYGFKEPKDEIINTEKFKCFSWNFKKTPSFFPTNIYMQLPHICNILNMTSRYLKPSTKFPSRMPTPWPSRVPTLYPTQFPSRFPTPWPSSKPTNLPSLPPAKILCKAGNHYNSKTNECIPCSKGRYNHGQMHYRENCYEVPNSRIFSYLNSTDIKCNFNGIPHYHNGEYEFGCNNYYQSDNPTIIPTKIPSTFPSQKITISPSGMPSEAPSMVELSSTCECPNIGLFAAIFLGSSVGIYVLYHLIRKFLRSSRRRRTENTSGIEIQEITRNEEPTAQLPPNDSMRVTIQNVRRQRTASI